MLFLTSNSSLADGISRHILNVCSYLVTQKEHIEIAVCITQQYGDLSQVLETNGVKVYHLNAPHGHTFGILPRFKRVLVDFKPTVLHSHIMSLFVRIAIGLYGKELPIVTTLHGIPDPVSLPQNGREKLTNWIEKSRNKILDGILKSFFKLNNAYYIYISTACKEQRMVKDIPGEVLFNPLEIKGNNIDFILGGKQNSHDKLMSLLHKEFGYQGSNEVKIIGFVGRIDEVKDVPSFLKVCDYVYSRHPDSLFVVVGCGPKLEEVQTNEEALHLGERIIWTGYRTDALDFIRGFDMLLLTSFREGGPIVVLEAFSVGTLVSSFDIIGGMQDVRRLAKENDIFVCDFAENRDCHEMGDNVVKRLWNIPCQNDTIRKNAYYLLQKHYSQESICRRLIEIYEMIS